MQITDVADDVTSDGRTVTEMTNSTSRRAHHYTDREHFMALGGGEHLTRGQSNLTKSASRGAHSPVRGHPRGSKVVPLNSWGRVSY